jgi:hypothetical protein
MSIPIVEYGQEEYMFDVGVWSGLKDMSKGRVDVSVRMRFNFSVSSLVVGRMYPTVLRAGWSASAQESLMMLWSCFLLVSLQRNVWSPQRSCGVLQDHVGVCCMWKSGSQSFGFIAISNAQFGRRLAGLLRHMLVSMMSGGLICLGGGACVGWL